MKSLFADLHIHVGRDWNDRPVKITGARSLTVTNIVKEASRRKGLGMVGVVDAQAPSVQDEIASLIEEGKAKELEGGGIQFEHTVLILGSEIEIYDASCSGPLHVLCYFPYLDDMRAFSTWLSRKMKNINLSTQRFYGTGRELQQYVREHGGLFIPAHMFTPFKSLYGKGVQHSLKEVLDPDQIDAVELGLSADTMMADQLLELQPFTYVTNSDAHSLGNLAREYQQLKLERASFEELRLALQEDKGRKLIKNYGLDPRMGKYHKTVCAKCLHEAVTTKEPCSFCGSKKIINGVFDRIRELHEGSTQNRLRPPYVHQVLLSAIPGIGHRTYERLLETFESEMMVIHEVPECDLRKVLPEKTLMFLLQMRRGELSVEAGGGGKYGKIKA
ncbi:TIGR00375 family protein [Halobacillus locisalis]|uniref:TIGR00375 family protein n=1 Tax=Halobacillus locisalis TaxID=220753 RepID=A0A838CP14_9BACI|nr:TIGR00375 family protein [Halobacillus locisalis]